MVIKGLWRQRLRARVTSVPVRASRFTLHASRTSRAQCALRLTGHFKRLLSCRIPDLSHKSLRIGQNKSVKLFSLLPLYDFVCTLFPKL